MLEKQQKKKIKWIISYNKERKWLESMANNGWFLESIVCGVRYTFYKDNPRKMLYEIDRYNLSGSPTLEDIQHKEIFLDMAKSLGWQEITHDESLTYYFAKEYIEDDINELYNDEESRRYRAEKFKTFFHKQAKEVIFAGMVVMIVYICVLPLIKTFQIESLAWFHWFVPAYEILCSSIALFMWWVADMMRKEMLLSREELEHISDSETHKKIRRLILTNRGLNKFLKREEANGWILTGVSPLAYSFERKEGTDEIYTLDSRWLTNKRLKENGLRVLKDKKDWMGINNDWQIQSVKDAQEKGWQFVCALENRAIIYRGEANCITPLNAPGYDNSLRGTSLIGKHGIILLISMLVGGIIGGIMA